MTSDKNLKLAAREYARVHGVPYTQARRAVTSQDGACLALPPLPTQMTRLDVMLGGGLPRGEVTALWAATGVGTSMFGITLARMTAMNAKRATLVMAESNRDVYVRRLIAATTGVTVPDLRRGIAEVPKSAWPPSWMAFLDLYEPDRQPTHVVKIADELRADAENTGRVPLLIVVDDLGPLYDYDLHNPTAGAPPVLAGLARDLGAAVVAIEALPSDLCRVPPAQAREDDLDFLGLSWPERVPTYDELRSHERTSVLASTATASLILTTPGDPPVKGEVTTLDLTVRSDRGPGGVMKVRRDGPHARIVPGS